VEVRDGRIVEERDYYDTMTLMTQLGVADAA
jgi:ketosteroid isomerase-like protein